MTTVPDRSAGLLAATGTAVDRLEMLAGIGSWAWDLKENRVSWSDNLHRLWGIPRDAFDGTYEAILESLHPDDRPRLVAAVERALGQREPYIIEHRVVLPDGGELWVESRGDVVVDDGVVIGLHGTTRDVTELRRRTAEAQEAAALLAVVEQVAAALERSARGPEEAMSLCATELVQLGDWPLARGWQVAEGRLRLTGSWAKAGDGWVELQRPQSDHAGGAVASAVARRVVQSCAVEWSSFTNVGTQMAAAPTPLTVRSVVAVPVRDRDGMVGVLEVFGTEAERPPEFKVSALAALGAVIGNGFRRRPEADGGASAADVSGDPAAQGELARLLPGALEREEFVLAYQPQVSLGSDRLVGVEALLRWNRPDGVVPPMSFIPLAEATGDIVAIGAWVLRAACAQAATWQRHFPGLRPWHVSVNISPCQFRGELVDQVRTALAESGLDPRTLRLELTESTLIDDVDFARRLIVELQELGVTLSLDDFGTGYSSLAYFREFALDEVKIDRSFVNGLGTNPGDTAIVASVLSLAHALDRTVVAEGVETLAQVEHLRSLGCDLAQGYLFGRPMPADEITPKIADSASGGRLRADEDQPADVQRLENVLVVDDSPLIRQLARMCLTAAGFTVSESGTGDEALVTALEASPECVLLDMQLPDMNGLEVCARLRSSPATADCAIVMLTGTDANTSKAQAFNAGADDYIVKPFVPRDLASRVQSAVRRRTARATRPA